MPEVDPIIIFDPMKQVPRGEMPAMDPAAVPVGSFLNLKGFRTRHGSLQVRNAHTYLTPVPIAGASFRGCATVWMQNVETLFAAFRVGSATQIWQYNVATNAWTGEITVASGPYGNTRFSTDAWVSFAAVNVRYALLPANNSGTGLPGDVLVISNGKDSARLYDPQSVGHPTAAAHCVPVQQITQPTNYGQQPTLTGGPAITLPSTSGSFPTGYTSVANGYTFTINAAAQVNALATYTDSVNGGTYTVSQMCPAGRLYVATTGSVTPGAAGTLTKTGGTGPATLTYTAWIQPFLVNPTAAGYVNDPAGNSAYYNIIAMADNPAGSAGGVGNGQQVTLDVGAANTLACVGRQWWMYLYEWSLWLGSPALLPNVKIELYTSTDNSTWGYTTIYDPTNLVYSPVVFQNSNASVMPCNLYAFDTILNAVPRNTSNVYYFRGFRLTWEGGYLSVGGGYTGQMFECQASGNVQGGGNAAVTLFNTGAQNESAPVFCPSPIGATAGSIARVPTPNGFTFQCSTASATVGAVYQVGGVSFNVTATIAGQKALQTIGASVLASGSVSYTASPPPPTGVLTKVSGTGDSTITYSGFYPTAGSNPTVQATIPYPISTSLWYNLKVPVQEPSAAQLLLGVDSYILYLSPAGSSQYYAITAGPVTFNTYSGSWPTTGALTYVTATITDDSLIDLSNPVPDANMICLPSAQCLCSTNDRLYAGVGSSQYVSDNAWPMRFSPYLKYLANGSINLASGTVNDFPGDYIQAMLTIPTTWNNLASVMMLTSKAVYFTAGTDAQSVSSPSTIMLTGTILPKTVCEWKGDVYFVDTFQQVRRIPNGAAPEVLSNSTVDTVLRSETLGAAVCGLDYYSFMVQESTFSDYHTFGILNELWYRDGLATSVFTDAAGFAQTSTKTLAFTDSGQVYQWDVPGATVETGPSSTSTLPTIIETGDLHFDMRVQGTWMELGVFSNCLNTGSLNVLHQFPDPTGNVLASVNVGPNQFNKDADPKGNTPGGEGEFCRIKITGNLNGGDTIRGLCLYYRPQATT